MAFMEDKYLHIVQLVNLTDEQLTFRSNTTNRINIYVPDLAPHGTVNVDLLDIMLISEVVRSRNWRIDVDVLKQRDGTVNNVNAVPTGTYITGGDLQYYPQITFRYSTVGQINNVFCIQGTQRKQSDETIRCSCFGGVIKKFLNKRPVTLIQWNHPQKTTMLTSPAIRYNLWGIGGKTPTDCIDDARDTELRYKVEPGQVLPIYSRFEDENY